MAMFHILLAAAVLAAFFCCYYYEMSLGNTPPPRKRSTNKLTDENKSTFDGQLRENSKRVKRRRQRATLGENEKTMAAIPQISRMEKEEEWVESKLLE